MGMLRSAVSYVGHRHVTKSSSALAGYVAIFVIAGLLLAWSWRPGDRAGIPADALILVLGYSLILMWLVNYPTYRTARYIELALQGRYTFPVLMPFYGLVAYYLTVPLPERVRPWVAGVAGGFYVYGDLPWLLPQLDQRWFLPF